MIAKTKIVQLTHVAKLNGSNNLKLAVIMVTNISHGN